MPDFGDKQGDLERDIRRALHAAQGRMSPLGAAYLGTSDTVLGLAAPVLRRIAKQHAPMLAALPSAQSLAILGTFFKAELHEEKILAALILAYSPQLRARVSRARLERWLGCLGGWAQIDALCANVFQADDLLADWDAWDACIRRLAISRNINKRRAALVLLTGPVRRTPDRHVQKLAFDMLRVLAGERDILITKAVSWLLRCLTVHHRHAVQAFLNTTALPAIAIRETRAKLETGTKSGRGGKTQAMAR